MAEITQQPQDITLLVGGSGSITVEAEPSTAGNLLIYDWVYYKPGISAWYQASDLPYAANANTKTLTFNNVPADAYTNWRCNVGESGIAGAKRSRTAILTVQANSPTITTQPSSRTAQENVDVTFSVKAIGPGTLTYQWQEKAPSGSWTDISSENKSTYVITASLDLNGYQYRVIVSYGSDSVISNSATLTVTLPKPTINSQPSSQIVDENVNVIFSVEASGAGTLTYQWQKKTPNGDWTNISGATNAQYSVTSSVSLNGTQYRVIVSLGTESVTSEAATLTVNLPKPTINSQPLSQTVKENSNVIFSVEATGTGTLTYQWQKKASDGSWTDISGATATEYAITASSDLNKAQYRVKVSNGTKSTISDPAILTVVADLPIITKHPVSQTVRENVNVVFYVEAAGSRPLSYQWQSKSTDSEWNDILRATSAEYSVTSRPDLNGMQYRVLVRFGPVLAPADTEVISEAATLTVLTNIPTITTQPLSQTVDENTSVIFSVEAAGIGTLSYQWQKKTPSGSWTNISGATNAQYSVTSASALNGTQYRVIVSIGNESVTSEAATLMVTSSMPEVTSHPADQTVDEGSMAFFAAAGRGVGTLSYQWQKKQGSSWINLSGKDSTAMTFAVSLSDNGTQYRCAISNSSGTAYSNPATLTVRQLDPTVPPPTIKTQPSDQTVNIGSNVTFSVVAEGTDLSYQWQEFVIGTNPYINISGATGSSYTFQALSGMTLRCVVSNAGGSASSKRATLTVERLAPTITEQPTNQGATEGSLVTLEIEATPVSNMETLSYQWYKKESNVWVSISGATQSTYGFTAQLSDNGTQYKCEVYGVYTHDHTTSERATSNIVTVSVTKYTAAPTILTQPSSQNVSEGTTVSLEVVAAGTQPINYKWQIKANSSDSWTNISGATNSVYTFTPNSTVYLRCVVSNSVDFVYSNTVTIQVTKSKPTIISQPPATLNVREGDLVELSVVAAGSNLSYQWQSMSDGSWSDISGEISATLKFAVAIGSRTDYRCVVSNDSGPTASDTSHLTITGRPPIITTQPLSQVVDEGTEVTFRAEVASTGTTQYIWLKKAPGENWTNLYNERTTEYTHTALFSENGTQYKLMVSANGQSVFSDPATLVVREKKVTITSQPTSKTVKENTNVIFSVEASGAGTLTYQWQKKAINGDWTDISGETNAQYSVTSTSALSGTQYRVIVSLGSLSVTSDAATLNVLINIPTITSQPLSQTVNENVNVIFSVTASGEGTLTYQWQKKTPSGSWTNISGATSTEYSVTSAYALNGTQYRVAIRLNNGGAISDAATLTVLKNVPTIITHPVSKTVNENVNVIFSVEASGAGTLTYQWQKKTPSGSWTNISGATNAQYSVTSTSALNGTQYRVIVRLGNESVTSEAATLNVLERQISIIKHPLNKTTNEQALVTFDIEVEGNGPLSYQWQKKTQSTNWTNILGAANPNYTFTALISNNNDQYRVIVTSGSTTLTSDAATLIVLSNAPTVTQSPQSTSAEENDSITLTAQGSGTGTLTYQWQRKDSGAWSDISGANQNTYTFVASLDDDEAEYRCAISNSVGTVYTNGAKLQVAMIPPVITTQPESQTVAEGNSVTFSVTATGSDIHHQWQISTDGETWINLKSSSKDSYTNTASISLNGTQIRDVVSNNAGTVYSDPATLTVTADERLAEPIITTQPSTLSLIEDQTGAFTVAVDGEDISYQWQILQNEVWCFINGANEPSLSVIGVLASNGSKYRCVISNPAGTVYSDEVVLLVREGSKIKTPSIYSHPRSVSVESGTIVYFRVLANGGSLEYKWERKRGNTWYTVSGATTNVLSFRATEDMNGDQYRCWVTNPAGGEASSLATLTVTERGPVPMYGYHSIIISGKNTYGEWTMYPTSRPHISPPEVKTSYVEVPGADGGLDYTELLNDKPNYGYRKGSWEFLLIPQDQWPNVYRSLCNFLHGREHTVVLEDDPNWLYTGRLSVNEWRSAAHNSLITIDYILDPDPVNISGEEYNQDELDLEGAERILRKPGNTDKAIVLWNNVATVVPITDMYEDGDNIAY